jgi:hypothetical protein
LNQFIHKAFHEEIFLEKCPEPEPEPDVAKIFVSLVRTISLLQDMLINVQYTFLSLLNQ